MTSLKVFILSLFFFLAFSSTAAVKVWTNNVGNNEWNNPGNWSPVSIPSALDSVTFFYGDNVTVPSGYHAEVKRVYNLGNITITLGGSLTITNGQLDDRGNFYNYGTLTVNDSPKDGIFCSSATTITYTFQNYGKVYINNSQFSGLNLLQKHIFNNHSGALLQVTGSQLYGIDSDRFHNYGILKLDNSDATAGINLSATTDTLYNHECGKIIILDGIKITLGLFTNDGFLKQNYDDDNDLISGGLINNSVIEDLLASFNGEPYTNNGMLLRLYEFTTQEGEPTSIIYSAFPTHLTVGNVYNDKNLTSLAGTYTQSTNIWIPNNNSVGDQSFYIKITDNIGGCSDTLRFNVVNAIPAVNYWIGGIGNWNQVAKWSKGVVPNATDNVAFYYPTDSVTILSGYTAIAKTIKTDGKLTVQANAILNLPNSTVIYGINCDDCRIVNNGTINMAAENYGIYTNDTEIINNGLIECFGSGTCLYLTKAFLNFDAYFINNGTVKANEGKLLGATSFSFTNNGTMNCTSSATDCIDCTTLTNSGLITIKGNNSNSGTGIDGYLENLANGNIEILKMSTGISASGFNQGSIKIEEANLGLVMSGTFINKSQGVLDIRTSNTGMLVYSVGSQNEAFGTIKLTKNQIGLQINSTSFGGYKYVNQGIMKMDSSLHYGMVSKQYFENHPTGEIEILVAGISGIENYGSFNNQGLISIKNGSGDQGLYNREGTFTNLASGQITIKDNLGYQLKNEQNFNNYGDLVLSSPPQGNVLLNTLSSIYLPSGGIIKNYGTWKNQVADLSNGVMLNENIIDNDYCGTWYNDAVFNMSSLSNTFFNNYGVFHHSGKAAINKSGVNFLNDGVFVCDERVFEMNLFNQQNGIHINSLSGPIDKLFTYGVSFQQNNANHTIGTTWYSDENLSNAVGTFNQANGTLQPTSLNPSQLWFEVNNPSYTCPMKVLLPIITGQPICNENAISTFSQTVDIQWNNRANWNTGSNPNACTNTIIPNTKIAIFPPNHYGIAHKLEAQPGSILDVGLGAVLQVMNE
ncbi:hypothetical protein SAMN06298216_2403 [Spirosomataceae bacterium TFI 002]|nr:hypothetical protein SAMN06298216_2403 [Spirosomataceae bacterium TFI 002]